MARGIAGLQSPLDRLPDDIMLRILVAAANDTEDSDGFASLDKLCQLRTVCARFDAIIPGAAKLVCTEVDTSLECYWVDILRFLQLRRAVKSLRLQIKVPQLFFEALSGAAPHLESLEINNGFLQLESDIFWDRGIELFNALSMCHHLSALKVGCIDTRDEESLFRGPLENRYPLRALRTLEISETSLEDSFVASIAHKCPCLETLNLVEVQDLKRTEIRSSTRQHLSISSCYGGPHEPLLEVEAPQLSTLKALSVGKLLVDAPNLEKLVLDGTKEFVKRSPWRVTTLDVGGELWTTKQLLDMFSWCPDAKVVLMRNLAVLADGGNAEKVSLSSLLHPFKQLEHLELPSALPEFPFVEQHAPVDLKPLATLRHLTVGFRGALDEHDLCVEFAKVAPNLKCVTINLKHMFKGAGKAAVDAMVKRSVRLQKLYPHLDLRVEWPELRIV